MTTRLTAAALLWAASPAHADAPTIDIGAGAPIDAAQLRDALRGRVGTAGAQPRVQIDVIPGGVSIDVEGRRRDVALGDAVGAEAARLVALAMVDLLDEPAVAEVPEAPEVRAVETPAPSPGPQVDTVHAPARHERRFHVSLVGGAARWSGTLATAGVDVVLPVGSQRIAFDVAVGRLLNGGINVDAGVLRASFVRRAGHLEGRLSLVASPLVVEDGQGDATVLVGAGASVRARFPLAGRLGFVASTGADVFATRTQYAVAGMPVAATPWLAPWMTVGLEVTP